MSYTNFTDENVFTDPQANAVCDYLFDSLQNAFPPEDSDPSNVWLFDSFILSGRAAVILRGGSGVIGNITFQVDRDTIYNYLVKNAGESIFKCKQISFKNRILLYPFPDLYLEIWYSDIALVPMSAGLIKFQEISNIPPLTL